MRALSFFSSVVLGGLLAAASPGQVNVTTYHNDNSRTGANTQETILTPSNVNAAQFGKLFSIPTDSNAYAMPLYLSSVSIAGGTHNVVYIATEHDSVYAADADNGTVYWKVSLIPAGGTTVASPADIGCGDMEPEVGITGTPVIDPTTGTLYAVARSKINGNFMQMLHAIDVRTGAEKFGGPTLIQATVAGTASDGTGSTVTFSPVHENQRAALLLENGHVIISWASHCDLSPWHGWLMSYNAATLAQEAVMNPSQNGYGNGVWLSAGGPAADSNGYVFATTGNGTWNGTTDFGNTILKLGAPAGGVFPILDYFTPYNETALTVNDYDLGSGGVVLLPTLPSGQQMLATMAKEGKIFLVDRNAMGKYCAAQSPPCSGSDPNIVQEVPSISAGVWGTPAYWNGSVYWAAGNADSGVSDQIKAFSFNANNNSRISTLPTSASPQAFAYPTPQPAVSANGTTNGILWGMDDVNSTIACTGGMTCQVLYAYDATNLGRMLYNSNQAANNADVPGSALKYLTPIIANGKVYVGTRYNLSVYGLLPATRSFASTSVNLAAVANVMAFANVGTAPVGGGLDGNGNAYAANYVGSSVLWNGASFTLGSAGTASAVTSSTVPLPAGRYSTLNLLATAVGAAQGGQVFTVTYTDGTTATLTQNMSTWGAPQLYANEGQAVNNQFRVVSSGAVGMGPWNMYGYSLALDNTRTVKTLTLPNNRNVILLAASLTGGTAVASPTFSLSAAPGTLALQQNLGGTETISVTPANGFSGTVNFSVSGLPAGVSTSFQPASSTSGTSLNVLVPSSTAAGTYPITVTGNSGGTSATTQFTLTVSAQASFVLGAASSSLVVAPGHSGSDGITVTPVNGFSGVPSFSATGFPAGVTGTFSPTSSPSGTTLTVAAAAGASPGTYPVTVTATAPATGSSNAFTQSITGSLIIAATATPGFSLSAPATVSLVHGGATGNTASVTVTPTNGFSGTVNFSLTGLPAGVSSAFLPTASSTGSTLVLYAGGSAVPGSYTIRVNGASGSATNSTAITLAIQ